MHLSQNQKLFSQFSSAFLKWRLNFQHFEKISWPSKLIYFRKYGLGKTWFHKYLKSPVLEDSAICNIVNSPKHCWYLLDSTFVIINYYCEENWVGKSLPEWYVKSKDCFFVTLPAEDRYSLLNRDNLTAPIQMPLPNYIIKFFLRFWNLYRILNIFQKTMALKAYYFQKYETAKDVVR